MRTLLLTLTTCLFVLPAQAKYSGGTGEPNDPYQIATAADLMLLGETPADYDKHFILTADIDLDPNLPGRKVFDKAVIARDWPTPFTGVFDGNGHTISHLTITGKDYLGLFGRLGSGAEVTHLGVVEVNITGSGYSVGGLVGVNEYGTVSQCHSTGTVTGNDVVGGLVGANGIWYGDEGVSSGDVSNCYSTAHVSGISDVGGLVGENYGPVTDCYSTGVVSGDGYVGGLVGVAGGTVSQCCSSGAVTGTSYYVGGLVGENYRPVTDCYSTGSVTGHSYVGGLAGYSEGAVTNCYSTGAVSGSLCVGGLVGSNAGTVTQCYSTGPVSCTGGEDAGSVGGLVGNGTPDRVNNSVWDMETSGLSGSAGGVGLTTAEMMDPDILGLNGFANDPNWVLDAGRDYPRLAWEGTVGQLVPSPRIDWLAGRGTLEEPYRIDTADQLILLGKASILWDKHFVLGADINLDPKLPGRQVFGQALIQTFAGVFDGKGHTISHLTIMGGSYLGLFGSLESKAEVKDLGVVDVNIIGSGSSIGGLVGYSLGIVTQCYSTGAVSGGDSVGGLVGHSEGDVANCYSSGAVMGRYEVGGLVGANNEGSVTNSYSTGAVSGKDKVGGLVGWYSGTVTHCYSTGVVTGTSFVGGLVGYNYEGTVTQCYSTGPVRGTGWCVGGIVGENDGAVTACRSAGAVTGDSWVGGMVGWNRGVLAQCYSSGAVIGNDCVGGLAAVNAADRGHMTHCYSTGMVRGKESVGGLVGSAYERDVVACFWDTQTSGQTKSAGGTGKTTVEMQTAKTFLDAGWDFVGETANGSDDVWKMVEGLGYPRLSWEKYSGGSGTAQDPYQIAAAADLMLLGDSPADYDNHFLLTADIDLAPNLPGRKVFDKAVIARDWPTPFTGVFDGNGHTISHLTITGKDYLGLFGRLGSGAEVTHLGVVEVNITGSGYSVGGLVGHNGGAVTECYSTGTVNGGSAGGLVGGNGGNVIQCYSTGVVKGNNHVGGLVGYNYGNVGQCYGTGAVSGKDFVGGLIGSNGGENGGTLTQCYSTGAVSGTGASIGGLLGGYTDPWSGPVAGCFWDIQTSGQVKSAGGIGKTTAQTQTAKTFLDAGWDFVGETKNGTEDLWWILEGKDYPRLWWEAAKK